MKHWEVWIGQLLPNEASPQTDKMYAVAAG
jgi:hypothetical protein